ncbi:MAG: mevalonate kinase [Chloroflexi bacterium]|nr:MAG: mevalonate kinase [Chloroflexota bacterium]
MTAASAPGKVILVGEHAVVYGRPAIAVPVWEVTATVTVTDRAPGAGCVLIAHDIGLHQRLDSTPDSEPLALVTRLALAQLGLPSNPDWQIELRSTIPIASGLGSGAALSAALVRALFAHAGQPVAPAQVSQLVYESERFYHGTPSGIDNTVVAHGQPVWFVKGEEPVVIEPKGSLTLLIADSGIAAPTKETVGDVRRGWQADPVRYEAWFDAIAAVAREARQAIEEGDLARLGRLFDENQALLAQLGVSSPPLERLVEAARAAGALGAKLSGGGRGGNVIALVEPANEEPVRQALLASGAKRTISTTVRGSP